MSSEIQQRQQRLQQQQRQIQSDIETQRSSPELYEEGVDLDNNKAAQMQEHSGNEAIQDLIDQLGIIEHHLSDLDGSEQEVIEDVDLDLDKAQQLKDGDGDDDGVNDDDPWAQEFFFGGEDEPIQIRRKRISKKRVTHLELEDEERTEDQKVRPAFPVIEDFLPSPEQGERFGDAKYTAVELGLKNLEQLIGHSLLPEDLQYRQGVNDPIRLPIEIGRFLEKHAFNEMACSLGALVGQPLAQFLTPQGGFSTAISRLATIALCAEITQGPARTVDTAISLSLQREAWERCQTTAKDLADQGELHAPKIAEQIIGSEALETEQINLPQANPLGGVALHHILPKPIPLLPPSINYPKSRLEKEDDDLLNDLDRILFEFTSSDAERQQEEERDEDPLIDITLLQPSLQTANQILKALGRAQVEFAACAVATHQVYPKAKMKKILDHCDSVLRNIARSTVQAGKRIERMQGERRSTIEKKIDLCFQTLRECHNSLQSLRNWALISFAGAAEESHGN